MDGRGGWVKGSRLLLTHYGLSNLIDSTVKGSIHLEPSLKSFDDRADGAVMVNSKLLSDTLKRLTPQLP
jgi:hypothetical protein